MCLHGAGHSAMSFAALAEQLKADSIVFSFDFRGHGDYHCENETDMTEEVLIADTIRVLEFVHFLYPENCLNLIGHSLGGSIATKTAFKIEKD